MCILLCPCTYFRPSLTEHILETILMLQTFSLPPLLGIVLRMIESFFPHACIELKLWNWWSAQRHNPFLCIKGFCLWADHQFQFHSQMSGKFDHLLSMRNQSAGVNPLSLSLSQENSNATIEFLQSSNFYQSSFRRFRSLVHATEGNLND